MEKLFRDKKAICLFIAPGGILFTIILLVPIAYAVYISLCEWNALTPPQFVGFANYIKLFTNDDIMKTAIKNSLFFTTFSLVTQQVIGLFLAVILSNLVKGKNLFKNIYYLPCVLSSAALGLLFSFLLNPKMGLNQILAIFGIQGPLWLMDAKGFIPLPMWVIGTVATWQYVGTTMMLYMAAIAGIPSSLYEASYIDGANKWQAFKNITMPLIKPMAKTTISLTCIGSLKFFDLIYNMTQGGPNHKTDVLATHLYNEGFQYFKYGYASAISVVLLAMCLFVTFIINRSIKVEDYEM
ncbi:MAG: sugar ABC transporter permease [Lachnospiraceae bacterium]|nr:sugar ABC transporter permease [Lachnospiraceae bacterium]MDD3659846.1 sugar ABC transporter permease [Lachnospiraceae bacterium]